MTSDSLESFKSKVLAFVDDLARQCGFVWERELEEFEGMLFLNFAGRDADLLLANGNELLSAVEYLLNKIFHRDTARWGVINCDSLERRQERIRELQLIAQTAAEKVKSTSIPYKLNPMDARERRVVHLALAQDTDVRTASEGEGRYRQVVIYPATH